MEGTRYTADDWQGFFEAAQTEGFDRTDVEREAPGMAVTVVDAFERLNDDEFVVQAAVDAANSQFGEWSIEQFAEVVGSYLRSEYEEQLSAKPWEEVTIFSDISGETYFFKRIS